MAVTISGTVSISGRVLTSTLIRTWGKTFMILASSESGFPSFFIAAATWRAVMIPSPVVWWFRKIRWPGILAPDHGPARLHRLQDVAVADLRHHGVDPERHPG